MDWSFETAQLKCCFTLTIIKEQKYMKILERYHEIWGITANRKKHNVKGLKKNSNVKNLDP
jgi:hypothetical protein